VWVGFGRWDYVVRIYGWTFLARREGASVDVAACGGIGGASFVLE
jgi:hypothetical protein